MVGLIFVAASLVIGTPDALIAIESPALAESFAPNLRVSGARVLLTWLERITTSRHRLRIVVLSKDQWTPPATIHESDQIFANWADVPSVFVADDGTMLAHWAEKIGSGTYEYEVALARSTDGKKWTRIAPANDDKTASEHGFVSMTAEKGGAVRVFWLDGREMAGGKKGPMTLRSAIIDRKRTSSEVLDARVCECCGTAAALTEDGPVIVYRDRDEAELRDIMIVRRAKDRWTAPALVHRDEWKIAGCPVNGPSIDARGRRVAVAWFTAATSAKVRLAFSDDAGATFGPPVRVDGAAKKETMGRVDVAIVENGDAIVTWLDAIDDANASIRARRVTSDGRTGAIIDLMKTSAARASGFPQIVRRGDELIIAWTEVGPPSRVRVARLPIANVP